MKTFLQSLAIGIAVTLGLFWLGYVASERGAVSLSYALYWQAWVLYQMLPCSVSLTPGEFLCESMAAAKAAFYAGIPVGILVYSAVAYVVLRLLRRGDTAQNQN